LLILFAISLAACEHGKGGGVPAPDGGGGGAQCGGFAGIQCAADEFCDFGTNSCGGTDESGTCKKRPTGCPDVFDPVCGCDGQIHGNQCDAEAAGTDLNAGGSCPITTGAFACGFRQCDLSTQYCQRGGSDVGGEPDSFDCMPIPIACGNTPSCTCLQSEPCGNICTGSVSQGFELLCPGG